MKMHALPLLLAFLIMAVPGNGRANCGPAYGADGIAVDGGGGVWMVHYEDNRLIRLDPGSGQIREFLPSTDFIGTQAARKAGSMVDGHFDYSADSGLTGIALDEVRRQIWSVRFASSRVVRFSLDDFVFREIDVGQTVISQRGTLPVDQDGNLWLLTGTPGHDGVDDGHLVRVRPSGEGDLRVALPPGTFVGQSIAVDRRGRPWVSVTYMGDEQAALFVLEGDGLTRRPPANVGRFALGLSFAPDNGLRLAAADGNAIAVQHGDRMRLLPLPRRGALPTITGQDPRGDTWFAAWDGNLVGRLHDGRMKVYPLPVEEEKPLTMAFAADGAVWLSTALNYNLFRLDPRTGSLRQFVIPPPANWFGTATAAQSTCAVTSIDAAPPSRSLKAARHPDGWPTAAAVLFEASCNTQCHSWYRVERAASRRSEWSATVRRMIEANGAVQIGEDSSDAIIAYLNSHYVPAARKDGR